MTAPAPEATRRRAAFHALRVARVTPLTEDSVAVTFTVPPALREAYRFRAGQHLAVRRPGGNGGARRTYSICTPQTADPAELTVGVREVTGGEFSAYVNRELKAGDTLEVMTPAGRFGLREEPRGGGYWAAVVGGSGITPVLSIAATLLAGDESARFCLIRSDRTALSTMFLEEVADLKDRWPDRFHLVQTLSREQTEAGLESGRLDEERLAALLPALVPVADVAGWFLCGPYGLVQCAERALRTAGVRRGRIHEEIFHVDDGTAPPVPAATAPDRAAVTARLGGRSGSWAVRQGETLLETVLRNRADAPYACKGGVCGTCRAFLVEGEVRMDRNFALEPDELEAGYVLACQSHPVTERVELDFDR
ncbi:1,2-phenylacetyl-CoA epoxidase, subunit E [Streptomyces sp. RB5]|uniref:1,2-phenylacetyl-CoA epoxidase, subunit E n=1 Tax=Streptomyces smaragdinus TaxID=2585196 RepID=A0A7K0CIA7_9ACTN|nr:2Fe-2S iron-sulfur cluster-binding protein [Streptomyces smaragdinus]MQY12732.1 1,2-phenylacetyl-CoA epoxidase, subunit E [Streptomyces smaragdinus]